MERARVRVIELAAVRAADVVVTTSVTTAERLRGEGIEAAIDVIVPGSDRLPRLPRAPAERVTFLFVGSVVPRKRVLELVHAFCMLPPGAALRVAGSRARDVEYAAAVTAAASGDVTFLDEIDDATLARELASAHALVMPSSLEGYGIAATEAIAAGLPVVAARSPGLTEALAPCADAVLFVASSGTDDLTNALAGALAQLASDPPLRARLATAAASARMPRWSTTIAAFRRLCEG
ncbi:MAG: glycosyltransferase family 4 protein [Labilithrix sp.]|nr:glycosyltransferase family 4 protein [Labilithrix sp.]MCW5810749.1 glycosyltransferase family 4 protein [Labilithrix sp.]